MPEQVRTFFYQFTWQKKVWAMYRAKKSTLVKQHPHSNFTNMASTNVSSFKKPNNNPQKGTHIQSSRINNFLQNLAGFLKANFLRTEKLPKIGIPLYLLT